jgi:hypothetical protein
MPGVLPGAAATAAEAPAAHSTTTSSNVCVCHAYSSKMCIMAVGTHCSLQGVCADVPASIPRYAGSPHCMILCFCKARALKRSRPPHDTCACNSLVVSQNVAALCMVVQLSSTDAICAEYNTVLTQGMCNSNGINNNKQAQHHTTRSTCSPTDCCICCQQYLIA